MAQITTGDINLRTGKANRLNIVELDTTVLTLQQTSLASSNSLVYKSASYSVNSNTSLPNPSQGYFNSRTIPSGIYYPFQDGSSFVFKFSDTDYGYYASASSTNKWWSVLSSVETAYEKRLCISQIGVSYNYWEFKMDSLSFTNSTWAFAGQKVLGPTYSNFEPEKQFTIGYRLSGGMTAGGNTNSIAGQIIDGYTTLNYPLLSETLYLGGVTNSVNLSYSDNDLIFDNISANVILSTTMSWPQDFAFRFDNVFVSATESNFLKIPTGTFINYLTYAIGQLNSGEFIYGPGSTPPHVYKISDWWGPVQNNPGDYVIDIGNNYIDIQFYGAQLDADKGKFGLVLWSSGTSSLSLNFPETSYPIAIKEYYTHDDGSEINNKIISLRPTGRKWRANEYLFLTMTNFYDYTDPQGLYNQDKIIFATASNPGNPIETLGKYSGVRFNIKYTRKFVGSLPFEPEPVEPGGSTYSLRPIDVGIQEKLYIGSDFDKLVTLSVTGPSYSIIGIGGEGMVVNKMYIGDLTYPLPIGATGGSAFGGTNSIVTVGGEGVLVNKIYLGDLTSPIEIGVTGGNDFVGPGLGVENLYLGSISFVGVDPNEPITNACWGLFKRRRRVQRRPGCPSCPPDRPARSDSNGQQIYEVPSDYFEILSTATNSQGISNFAGVHVGALTIGLSESNAIEMAVMTPTGWISNWEKPTKILAIGSYITSSNNNFYDSVGIDTYAMSTSYLEITPITYSTDATNILLNGSWGIESSGTYSVLNIDSDGVSVNKLYFGNINNGQSLVVSGGDLYVNDSVFSGGGSGSQGLVGATGPQGEVGPTGPAGSLNYGTQSFTYADTISVTHSFGRYPIIQVMDTTYDPPQMFSPAKIEYTTIDSFLVTFATSSSGILIYMC